MNEKKSVTGDAVQLLVDDFRNSDIPFSTWDEGKPREGKAQGFVQKSQGIPNEGNGPQYQQPVQFVIEDNSR